MANDMEEVPSLERFLPPPEITRAEQEARAAQKRQATELADEKMQLAWDEWHRRVSETIYNKIVIACRMSRLSELRELRSSATFKISKERHVTDAQIIVSSANIFFDSIVINSINSMNNNESLQFPNNSVQESVDKRFTAGWAQRMPRCHPTADYRERSLSTPLP